MILPYSDRRIVTDATYNVRLADRPTRLKWVQISPDASNSGTVYVGGSNVSSVSGFENAPKLTGEDSYRAENVDLHDLYVAADTADDCVVIVGEIDDEQQG